MRALAFRPSGGVRAPLGLERIVASARSRGLFTAGAFNIFGAAMVCLSAVMTGYVLWIRVLSGCGARRGQVSRSG